MKVIEGNENMTEEVMFVRVLIKQKKELKLNLQRRGILVRRHYPKHILQQLASEKTN